MNRLLMAFRTTTTLVLALTAGTAGAEVWREQSEKVVEATGYRGVRVENARGTSIARPSPDGRIHVTAYKVTRGKDRETAQRLAARIQVLTEKEGGEFVVRVRYPSREEVRVSFWELFKGYEFPTSEVRVAIDVPASLPVTLVSTSGDLITEDIATSQRLETTSGDVEVQGARSDVEIECTSGDVTAAGTGKLRVRSVSGDVEIDEARGPVRVKTASGDISVRAASDSVAVITTSGSIRVHGAPRGLTAQSASGDIEAGAVSGVVDIGTTSGEVLAVLKSPLTSADITSASGDINATLEGSVGGPLEMRTSSGSIDVNVTLDVDQVSRHLVSGRLGRGNTPMRFKSTSGDIQVSKGGGD